MIESGARGNISVDDESTRHSSPSPGWIEERLQDVVRPDSPVCYGIVQPGPYTRDGIRVLAIRDLANGKFHLVHRSSRQVEAAYRRSRVKSGDVLVSVKGTTGRIGIVPDGFEGNISRDLARVRLREEHDPHFWYQLLQSAPAQRQLQQATVGTTRQELSIGVLKRLLFSHPSIVEQRAIAATLSDFDEFAQALALLLAKKMAIMRGACQRLLIGTVRLAGFSKSWLECTIDDIATVSKGQQLNRTSMNSQMHVPVWNGGVEPSGFTDSPNVHQPVVTVSEGGNSCGWVGRPRGSFWLGGHCYALEPKELGHSVAYLYHALKAREPAIMSLRVGSGLPNIQKRRLLEFGLVIPADHNEATAIAAILDDMAAEIDVLEHRLHKAEALKQGSVQQVLGTHACEATAEAYV